MSRDWNRLDFILAYETTNMHPDDIVVGFQHMINDGTVWHLQGHYGRMAVSLIEAGYCTKPEEATG